MSSKLLALIDGGLGDTHRVWSVQLLCRHKDLLSIILGIHDVGERLNC